METTAIAEARGREGAAATPGKSGWPELYRRAMRFKCEACLQGLAPQFYPMAQKEMKPPQPIASPDSRTCHTIARNEHSCARRDSQLIDLNSCRTSDLLRPRPCRRDACAPSLTHQSSPQGARPTTLGFPPASRAIPHACSQTRLSDNLPPGRIARTTGRGSRARAPRLRGA